MTHRSIFWGIVLIIAGFVFILSNMGILTFNIWQFIGPMLLILFGIWVIVGAIAGRGATKTVSVPSEGIVMAHMQIDFAAGKLNIQANSDPYQLIDGELSDGFDLNTSQGGNQAEITLKLQPQFFPLLWIPNGVEWNVRLNTNVVWSFNINTGASETIIDLTGLKVGELVLNTGASSTSLTLPAEGRAGRYTIKAGLAGVNVRIPSGVSASIRSSAGLGAVTVDQSRFFRRNGEYKSDNYDAASNRVNLAVEVGLGGIDIR
jgi:predicted membrane protein